MSPRAEPVPSDEKRYNTLSAHCSLADSDVMKNRRRRARRQRRAWRRAEREWIEAELANPSPDSDLNANVDEALINHSMQRCLGCGGRGWKERRDKPAGKVPCRVCSGYGSMRVSLIDGRITPHQPAKVYWHRHWPPRTSRWG